MQNKRQIKSPPDDVRQPIRRWPDELRPRERLMQHGSEVLNDAELLAILLRTGTRKHHVLDIAGSLIAHHGGLLGLSKLSPNEWLRCDGVGPQKAASMIAALELGKRTWTQALPPKTITTSQSAWRYIANRFLGQDQEQFWVIGLEANCRIVTDAQISKGTGNMTIVKPADVFRPLIKAGAVRAILCHNHPSGDLVPSQHDLDLTTRLIEAGSLIGIEIIDHLIISDQGYRSLQDLIPFQS